MKLTFNQITELELCDVDAEGEVTGTSTDTVPAGTVDEVELLGEDEDAFHVIFEDGKVSSVPKSAVTAELTDDDFDLPPSDDEAAAVIVVGDSAMLADALANTAALNEPVDLVRDEADDAAANLAQHQQPEQ